MAHIVVIPKDQHLDGKQRYKVRWRTPNGKTSNKTFRRRADANAFKVQVENDALTGVVTNPKRTRRTVESITAEWQTAGDLRGKRGSTLSRDEAICRIHIIPALGNQWVSSITEEDIQELVNSWADRYMPRTVQRHYAILRAIFTYAVHKKIIATSPCSPGIIGLPVPEPVDHPVLTTDQLSRLASALGPDDAAFMWAGVEGLRWAEVAGLTSDRVDQDLCRIKIDRQMNRDGQFATLKTRASRRSFKMTEHLAAALADVLRRKGLASTDTDALLFTSPKGGPLRYTNWRTRVWEPACEAAGLEGLNFHDLRALAATSMIAAGVDIKTAQSRLGHESITTTADIYARQSPEADRLAAVAVGNLLKPEPRPSAA